MHWILIMVLWTVLTTGETRNANCRSVRDDLSRVKHIVGPSGSVLSESTYTEDSDSSQKGHNIEHC